MCRRLPSPVAREPAGDAPHRLTRALTSHYHTCPCPAHTRARLTLSGSLARRVTPDERKSADPFKSDTDFDPAQISSQTKADEDFLEIDNTDYEHTEGSDDGSEDVDELGLITAAHDVNSLQHYVKARWCVAALEPRGGGEGWAANQVAGEWGCGVAGVVRSGASRALATHPYILSFLTYRRAPPPHPPRPRSPRAL